MVDLNQYGLRPQRPEVIDSSMLKDFVDCPSLFYLRHVLGLRKTIRNLQREAPMDWGTLWHSVMEMWGKTHDVTLCLALIDDEWPDSVIAETDSHGRSPERMKLIFVDYVKTFGVSDLEDFDILRHEQFFDVTSERYQLRWCGRIDRIERRKRTKRLLVRDFKTTSWMGNGWFEQHEFGFQIPGYVLGANEMTTEPIDEAMLDVLYTLKTEHKFFRRTFRIGPERIAEWAANVRRYLNELECLLDEHLEEPEAWRKNWNHCTRWGMCSFADVHFLPAQGDTRLRVLSNDYHEERWNPLQHSIETEEGA